jgi:hypothetical protein
MSLRDTILNANDLKEELVEVPEWGCSILVRSMTGKERSNLFSVAIDAKGKLDFEKAYPVIIIASAFDPETKEKVFTTADMELLNGKNAGAMEKVAKVAMRLSGLDTESAMAAEKNS